MHLKPKSLFALIGAWLGLAGAPQASAQAPAPTGSVQGIVLNAATGRYVEGADVTLDGGTRTERTDSQGRFAFGGVPAGAHRVVVDSTGTNRGEVSVDVSAGQTASVTLRLQSEIVAMQALMV